MGMHRKLSLSIITESSCKRSFETAMSSAKDFPTLTENSNFQAKEQQPAEHEPWWWEPQWADRF